MLDLRPQHSPPDFCCFECRGPHGRPGCGTCEAYAMRHRAARIMGVVAVIPVTLALWRVRHLWEPGPESSDGEVWRPARWLQAVTP